MNLFHKVNNSLEWLSCTQRYLEGLILQIALHTSPDSDLVFNWNTLRSIFLSGQLRCGFQQVSVEERMKNQ
jgi:hypothetical protein